MPFKRLVILALLLVAVTPCWAGERDKRDTGSRDGTRSVKNRRIDSRRTRDVRNEDLPILGEKADDSSRPLAGIPRSPIRKIDNSKLKPMVGTGGSIIVKFMDQVKARCEEGILTSYSGVDLSACEELIKNNSLEIEPLFKISFERLAAIEDKAVRFSNKAQPDLASMMKISGPRGRIQQVARQLNNMAIIEYVEFEKIAVPAMQQENIACCIQNSMGAKITCLTVTMQDCIAMSGAPNENAVGPFACFDSDGDTVADACVGACCFKTAQGAFACQSNVSPLDCTLDTATFIDARFSGRGTACVQNGGVINCELRGACCIDLMVGEPLCVEITKFDCLARGEDATFTTAARDCDDVTDDPCVPPGCGDDTAGDCFIPTPPPLGGIRPSGNSPFCDQDNCCQSVCSLIPECCDNDLDNPGDWDDQCAAFANIFRSDSRDDINNCGGPPPPPLGPCNISGTSCFATSASPGCAVFACCQSVCSIDPSCCDDSLLYFNDAQVMTWDDNCVELARNFCAQTPQTGTTPDFFAQGIQGYLTATPFFVVPELLVGGMIIPACVGASRSTPEIIAFSGTPPFAPAPGYSGEGFDLEGLESVGRALADLGKGDISMSRGKNIKIGVIDDSAYIQSHLGIHEDLAGQVTIMPTNRTMTLLPAPIVDPEHGTAVLGILAANSTNGLGMISMAPEADVFFFPAATLEDGGRILSAMVDIAEAFEPGDVAYIALSNGEFGINGCGNILSDAGNWILASVLTSTGITVVIPADNNACDLVGNPQAGDADGSDAGAIVVGAVTPGLPYSRISASNHCSACTNAVGDIVHVAGWGAMVATLGTGDMWSGEDISNPRNNYTNSFGYTSAAGAQITALVARYQGLAKQMYGMPFSPLQIRGDDVANLLGADGLFSSQFLIAQDNRPIGGALGTPNGLECFGDFSFQDDPNTVMGLPNALTGAAWVVAGSHFGESARLLRNVTVVRGNHLFGNHFALGTIDQNYLIVESEFTERDQAAGPVTPPDPTLSSITYLAAGQITDIVVDLEAELSVIGELQTQVVVSTTTTNAFNVNMLIVELYDWSASRWDFVGLFQTVNGDFLYAADVLFGHQRFVRSSDDMVKLRIYTVGLGGLVSPYTARYDFAHIDVGFVPGDGQIIFPDPP